MELDLQRDVEAELLAERMHLRARTDDHAAGRPKALGGAKENAARLLDDLEHLSEHDPLAESAGEPIHRGANVDRPAGLVESASSPGGEMTGSAASLPVTIDEPRRYPRGLERGRPLRHVRTADQHTLAPEQPNPELLLEPLPFGPSTHGHPNQPLVVVAVPKHPRAPGRLPRPRSSGLEQSAIDTPPPQRISRRQPADPTAHNSDIQARNAHARTVRLSTSAQ